MTLTWKSHVPPTTGRLGLGSVVADKFAPVYSECGTGPSICPSVNTGQSLGDEHGTDWKKKLTE